MLSLCAYCDLCGCRTTVDAREVKVAHNFYLNELSSANRVTLKRTWTHGEVMIKHKRFLHTCCSGVRFR